MVTNRNKSTTRKIGSKGELGSIGTCCPQRLWSLHSWKSFIIQLGKGLSKMFCLYHWYHCEFGANIDDLQSSSPNQFFFMMPWFFSEAYGHLIPITVASSIHISSSQGHTLILRGQVAWGNRFFYCCSPLQLHLAYVCTLSGNYASSEENFCHFVSMC